MNKIFSTIDAQSPQEVINFFKECNLNVGDFYTSTRDKNSTLRSQVLGYNFDNYWNEYFVIFDNCRVSFSRWLICGWIKCKETAHEKATFEVNPNTKNEHDADYYRIKKRHTELCQKKLKIMEQGKNKSMRNAYINQELEMLREKLFQYKE